MTITLVFGIGNVALADHGAGVYAMRYLRDHYDLPDTSYRDVTVPGDADDADIATADNLIILGTADLEAEPGTVRVFQDQEVDEFLAGTAQEDELCALLDAVRGGNGHTLAHYALIGIQPGHCGPGTAPTETVRRSMPKAAGNAAALVYKWRRPDFGRRQVATKREEPADI